MRSGGSDPTSHFREARALFAFHMGLLHRISLESRSILKEREGKVGRGTEREEGKRGDRER